MNNISEEDKKLLLKCLCGRLPYGVKGKVKTIDGNGKEIEDEGILNSVFIDEYDTAYICIEGAEYELEDFKPYLRSMSDMTEEEKKEIKEYIHSIEGQLIGFGNRVIWLTDYYLSHHIDFRGMIEKGLALPAPNDMYKIEKWE